MKMDNKEHAAYQRQWTKETRGEKPRPVQKFRIILDALQGGELTTEVPREILLEALDHYTTEGRRWLVVPA
jgi:hypothetical protein